MNTFRISIELIQNLWLAYISVYLNLWIVSLMWKGLFLAKQLVWQALTSPDGDNMLFLTSMFYKGQDKLKITTFRI